MTSYGQTPRGAANYKTYHEMALAGLPERAFREAFDPNELELIQEIAVKRYWAHVRDLLRRVPVFQRKLEFLEGFMERPVEEILESIMTVNFPQVTIAVTQRNHNMLREWINELYLHATDQLEQPPVPANRRTSKTPARVQPVRNYFDESIPDRSFERLGQYHEFKQGLQRRFDRIYKRTRERTPPLYPHTADPDEFDEMTRDYRTEEQWALNDVVNAEAAELQRLKRAYPEVQSVYPPEE